MLEEEALIAVSYVLDLSFFLIFQYKLDYILTCILKQESNRNVFSKGEKTYYMVKFISYQEKNHILSKLTKSSKFVSLPEFLVKESA